MEHEQNPDEIDESEESGNLDGLDALQITMHDRVIGIGTVDPPPFYKIGPNVP